MIYILKKCVNWEGSEIITATSTVSSLIEKLKKLTKDDRVSFGDYCELEFYNGIGDLLGKLKIERSEIPGLKNGVFSWGLILNQQIKTTLNFIKKFKEKSTAFVKSLLKPELSYNKLSPSGDRYDLFYCY